MEEVLQPSMFDPLVKFIREVDINGKITFQLPLNFNIDVNIAKSFFHDDAYFNFERGRPFNVFCGTLKDLHLAQYLYDRWQSVFYGRSCS